MWEIDDSWDGFQWLVHDDNTQNVVIFRRTNDEGDDVIAICNFAPVERRLPPVSRAEELRNRSEFG